MANVHSKQVDQQALYKLHDQMSKELAGKVHDAVKDGKPAESPIPGGQFENFTTMLSHADQIAQANLIAGETVDPKALAGRVFNTEFHTPSGLMPQLNTTEPLKLSEKQMEKLLVKMPCPFMGNMVKEGKLPVFGSPEQPIIKTEDIIKASGQGSLSHSPCSAPSRWVRAKAITAVVSPQLGLRQCISQTPRKGETSALVSSSR